MDVLRLAVPDPPMKPFNLSDDEGFCRKLFFWMIEAWAPGFVYSASA
jgi:hypothetical protein